MSLAFVAEYAYGACSEGEEPSAFGREPEPASGDYAENVTVRKEGDITVSAACQGACDDGIGASGDLRGGFTAGSAARP